MLLLLLQATTSAPAPAPMPPSELAPLITVAGVAIAAIIIAIGTSVANVIGARAAAASAKIAADAAVATAAEATSSRAEQAVAIAAVKVGVDDAAAKADKIIDKTDTIGKQTDGHLSNLTDQLRAANERADAEAKKGDALAVQLTEMHKAITMLIETNAAQAGNRRSSDQPALPPASTTV